MTKAVKVMLGAAITIVCLVGAATATVGYLLFSVCQGQKLYHQAYEAVGGREYDVAVVKLRAALQKKMTKNYRSRVLADLGFSENAVGHCDEAIKDFTEALRLDPNYAYAYESRGSLYDQSGERENAFKDFSDAIRVDPNAYHAFFSRGLIDMEHKDVDQAIDDFSEAVRIDPSSAAAYNNRGLAYSYKKEIDRALSNFDAAIAIKPDYATALGHRGYIYLQKKELEKAIADLNAAIRLDPDHAGTYRTRGFAFQDQKRWNEAIADFSKTLQLDPKDLVAREGRASSYSAMGDQDRAINEFTEILKVWQLPDTYCRRGSAYSRKGDFAKANADFNEAVKLAPDNDTALNDLAWFLATCPDSKFRNGREAVAYATKACNTSGWRKAYHIDTLAAASAETGNFEAAVNQEDQAIQCGDASAEKIGEMRQRRDLYRNHKPYRLAPGRGTE